MARSRRRAKSQGMGGVASSIATTLAARTPMLLNPLPSASDLAERDRMVREKIEAAAHGTMDASFAMGAFWLRFMTGGVRGPGDVLAGMSDVAKAATRPAVRTVRANARRLSRKS